MAVGVGIGVGVAVSVVHAIISSVPKPKTSQRGTVRMVGIVAKWPSAVNPELAERPEVKGAL